MSAAMLGFSASAAKAFELAESVANAADCARWVIFEATLVYTSASSESEDSATFSVDPTMSVNRMVRKADAS